MQAGSPRDRVADIGSGAGFPGLVWKIVRPRLDLTLFDRRLKPQLFLDRVVAQLGLKGIAVIGEDAANCKEAGTFDLVVSKAAGRLASILPLADRLLAPGGAYLTVKGRSWESEMPQSVQSSLRLESVVELPEEARLGGGVPQEPARLIVSRETPDAGPAADCTPPVLARYAGPAADCTPRVLARTASCAPRGDPISVTRYRCSSGTPSPPPANGAGADIPANEPIGALRLGSERECPRHPRHPLVGAGHARRAGPKVFHVKHPQSSTRGSFCV